MRKDIRWHFERSYLPCKRRFSRGLFVFWRFSEMVESMAFLRKKKLKKRHIQAPQAQTSHTIHIATARWEDAQTYAAAKGWCGFRSYVAAVKRQSRFVGFFLSFFPLSSSLWNTASQRVFSFCVVCMKSRKFPRKLVAKKTSFSCLKMGCVIFLCLKTKKLIEGGCRKMKVHPS